VTRATCNGVQQAVARLAGVSGLAARRLSTRDTQCFGALPPDVYGAFLSPLIRSIDPAARALRLPLSCAHAVAAPAGTAVKTRRGRSARSRAAQAIAASDQRRRR